MSTFKMLNLQVIFTLLFLIAYSWTAELSDQVIDGHNDLPYNLYKKLRNNLDTFNFDTDLTEDAEWGSKVCSSCFTDIPRLKKGNVGAQFWVAYVDCKVQYRDAFAKTVEQIDVIKRLVKKYEDKLQFASSASEIKAAITGGKIGSLIGVEGGHSMDSRLSVLRTFYDLGVRYMTLTHSCNTPWADTSAVDDSNPIHNLTEFGKTIVQEMNRLGMMVDLAHVSHNVMRDALAVTRAPVIFSHSSAYAVTKHHRNVPDDVLELVKKNKGVVMVNFFSPFVNANPDKATINDVVDHINHIVEVAGIESVGIGADYDGVVMVPKGLEDVSKYPDLFALLKEKNGERWTDANVALLANGNFLRVFKAVEEVRDELVSEAPNQHWISDEDLNAARDDAVWMCRTLLNNTSPWRPKSGASFKSASIFILIVALVTLSF